MIIEKYILEYLSSKLDCPVYLEEPSNIPSKYVLLEKTGESLSSFIYSGTFAIQSFATTLYETAKLDAQVRHAMFNIIDTDRITRSNLNASYNYTDQTTMRYRYQSVYDLKYYGDEDYE